jgi:addiction module RelE/StbE family toxin
MRRKIKFAESFPKKAKKLLRKNLSLEDVFREVLYKLSADVLIPSLHTHALSGDLKGKYACSLTYDLRIIFKLSDDTVHLLDIGSHDEVY